MEQLRKFIRNILNEDIFRDERERQERRRKEHELLIQAELEKKREEEQIKKKKEQQISNAVQHIDNNIYQLIEELKNLVSEGKLEKFPRNNNEYFISNREMGELIGKYGFDENIFYKQAYENRLESYGISYVDYPDHQGYVFTAFE